VVPEGEVGETGIHPANKEAMPGWWALSHGAIYAPDARQGAPMRRMERFTAAPDDMMIVRGVNVFPTQIEELILRDEAARAAFSHGAQREDGSTH